MHVMASVRGLGKFSASRGTSDTILYLECYPKCSKYLEMKRSNTPQLSDSPTILIDNWDACVNNRTLCIFHNGWIDCRAAFYTVFHL